MTSYVNISRLAFIISVLICLYFLTYTIKSSSPETKVVESEQSKFEVKKNSHDVTLSNIKILSYDPRIYLIDNFISDEECEYIINLGGKKVKRSKVVGSNGKAKIDDARTSSGVFLPNEDEVLMRIGERIAKVTYVPRENGENFYLLRYRLGEEYRPHTDWFDRIPEFDKILSHGQRIATVVSYLSDVEEGGETVFPELNLEVKPKKGSAIVFWNIDLDGRDDPRVLHGSKPVIKGTKWAMTRWIRSMKQWWYLMDIIDILYKQKRMQINELVVINWKRT